MAFAGQPTAASHRERQPTTRSTPLAARRHGDGRVFFSNAWQPNPSYLNLQRQFRGGGPFMIPRRNRVAHASEIE
jgi:hypothetical protein